MKTLMLLSALFVGCAAECASPVLTEGTFAGVNITTLSCPAVKRRPTLFVFSGARQDTMNPSLEYNEVGRILAKKGWLIVSMDLPSHGEDGGQGLDGWRVRMLAGENLAGRYCEKVKSVAAALIAADRSMADQLYTAGTSRGGWIAGHVALHQAYPVFKGAALFSPVTKLGYLTEFNGFDVPNISDLHEYGHWLAEKPIRIWQGPDDTRVGTVNSVSLIQAAGTPPGTLIRLDIKPAVGHNTPEGAHVEAAEWLCVQRRL